MGHRQAPDRTPEPIVPTLYQPTPDISCWHADFRQLQIADGSVDAVVGDIPWDNDFLRIIPNSPHGAPYLKPGGIATTLYTPAHMDIVLAAMTKHLKYVWCLVIPWDDGGALQCAIRGSRGLPPSPSCFLTARPTSGEPVRLASRRFQGQAVSRPRTKRRADPIHRGTFRPTGAVGLRPYGRRLDLCRGVLANWAQVLRKRQSP